MNKYNINKDITYAELDNFAEQDVFVETWDRVFDVGFEITESIKKNFEPIIDAECIFVCMVRKPYGKVLSKVINRFNDFYRPLTEEEEIDMSQQVQKFYKEQGCPV